jgi:hypothetical protein
LLQAAVAAGGEVMEAAAAAAELSLLLHTGSVCRKKYWFSRFFLVLCYLAFQSSEKNLGNKDRKYWIRLNCIIEHFNLPIVIWSV